MAKRAEPAKKHDIVLDDALEQSFPASDPPSQTNPSQSTKTDCESLKRADEKKGKKAPRR